jgi:hypothetical protein
MLYIVLDGSASPELKAILEKELRSEKFNCQPIVIHAGHYFLEIAESGVATDRLNNPNLDRSELIDHFALFSRETWEMACLITAASPAENRPRLVVLVNDWQYLVPKESSRRQREQAAARLRREYYTKVPGLTEFHSSTMTSCGLPYGQILSASREQWMFSESELRAKFAATLKSVMKDPIRAEQLGITKQLNEDGEPIISFRAEGQQCTLLHCGNAGCAGEVVELLRQLYEEKGVRNFINIFPACCRVPVERGTEIAQQLFGLDGMEIVNIAVV